MMHFKRFSVLFFALVLAGQGCLGAGTPEAAPGGGSGDVSRSEGCSHPYMPLNTGSSITYRSTGSGEDTVYTQSVSSNTGNQATLEYSFENEEGLGIEYTLNCTSDGVFADGFVDLSALGAGTGVRTETKSSSGPFLPETLDVGTSWSNHFEMTVHYSDPRFPISEANQTMDISRTAVRRESVTVPAGTFDALVVEADFTMATDALPTGPLSFSQTEYWVEGVGMVKSEGGGPIGGASVTEAVEIVR